MKERLQKTLIIVFLFQKQKQMYLYKKNPDLKNKITFSDNGVNIEFQENNNFLDNPYSAHDQVIVVHWSNGLSAKC